MDRSWMYPPRRDTVEYLTRLQEFINCAEEDMRRRGDCTVLCPCQDCRNLRRYKNIEEVRGHLIRRGFKERYSRWIWHGESVGESADAATSRAVENTATSVDPDIDVAVDCNVDNVENINELDELMHDVEAEFIDIPDVFQNLCNNSKIPLYSGCSKFTKLSAIFKLYNLKARNGWSDKSFTDLLELLREMLPEGNELPDSTYRAKKLLCPLSMEVERIHACPNDCIIYRNEYIELDKCPVCGVSRYKPNHDLIKNRKTRPAAKVFWYLSIISRFRRFFANPRDVELLRWRGVEQGGGGHGSGARRHSCRESIVEGRMQPAFLKMQHEFLKI